MLLAIGLAGVVMAAGFAVLRALGLAKGLAALGLSPAAGLAVLGGLTAWSTLLGGPPVVATLLLVVVSGLGAAAALRQWRAARFVLTSPGEHRVALLVLLAALAVPAIVMSVGFGGLDVPFSTHDGAFHVETIESLRTGYGWHTWYPPAFHTIFAAFLTLVPWVDSADGTFQASLGLILLAQLGIFGLGCALWRRPLVAAGGALLVGLTYQFPYTVQFWALWPMLQGIILVLGVWTVCIQYLEARGLRWAILCGVLAGGVGLSHTVEVYTALIGLPFIVIAHWRRIPWARLAPDIGVALAIALALFIPYLSTVLIWAHGGGAVSDGAATGANADGRLGISGGLAFVLLDTLSGFVADLPLRVLTLALGIWLALRTASARPLLGMGIAFVVVPLVLVYVDHPLVEQIFALTYPWSHGYRLFMVAALLLAMLGGAGAIAAVSYLAKASAAWVRRAGVMAAGLVVLGALVLIPLRLIIDGEHDAIYLKDDQVAMAWLRENAAPGELIANDWASDAGIWAPYKAGVRILLPRMDDGQDVEARELVANHIGELERAPDARIAACALSLRYVYSGASRSSFWEPHRFPTRDELRQSGALEEVFQSGEASVFRTRLGCEREDF